MEHSVRLGTQRYRESLCQQLLELKEQEKLPFDVEETQLGKRWLIQCRFSLSEVEDAKEWSMVTKIHRYYLANVLAETILRHWEKDYVLTLLQKRYHLKRIDQESVRAKVMKALNERHDPQNYRHQRKNGLVSQILTNLEANPVFEVEGFLHFQAREYRTDVEKAVASVVDEHVLEKEYFEFIDLLKHFLATQKPCVETLHVEISASGKFHLYNEQGDRVTKEYLDGIDTEGEALDFSYEDLLISALISAAPREVVLHIRYSGYRDTLETIRKVFEGKIRDCPGCSLCEGMH